MSNRPGIPAEIAREVLLESGHRCAVCGTPCPLERAHIIPWHKSREHKAEDLICLCANCHERADKENWGEKALGEHKRNPWVLRQYKDVDRVPESAFRLEITIGMDSSERFDDKIWRWLQYGIAAFLEIPPQAVKMIAIEQGSVKVTIELPARGANRLMIAYQERDPELFVCLAPLILLDLRRKATVGERIPFSYGNPVAPDRFLDRRRELRRLAGRIVNRGQSTAIVGEPRSGRTSLFLYLAAPETRAQLYGEGGDRLVFSYMDAQTLGGGFSQAQFWEYALHPLYARVIATQPNSPMARAYEVCRENDFGCFVLERLFSRVEASGWRVVLLLDEFDVLLYHPILNSAEFFGSLRSLASRSQGALALVIASRRSLTDLNEATQQFSCTGSPYFNFLAEVTLGPLPNNAVAELLRRAEGRFTPEDNRLIVEMAGGHPYLLQVAASELWEAYAEFPDDPKRRWREAGHRLYREALDTLTDIWRLWSPAMRKAFTVVALAEMSGLGQKKFRVKRRVRDLSDLGPELRMLRDHGFIIEDENIPGGWQVRPQVFLWWLADDLATMVRREMPFGEWLQRQELGSILAGDEKEQWGKAVQTAGVVFREGVKVLIEATIQGFWSGAVTGV